METVIALDAMGGDHGPKVVVASALRMLEKYKHLKLILVGDEQEINRRLARSRHAVTAERIQVQHASESVEMDEPPANAMRNKKDSSMRVALNLVKEGKAQACVSAGNTGALMATARFVLKMLPGIDRPAMISAFPTANDHRPVYMLDLGANVDSTPENLFQFAVMGSIVCAARGHSATPSVSLLNIGTEDIKGNELVKKTAELLRHTKEVNYVGFVEGDDLLKGKVDVIVCDGFIGNAVLKTMEGTAKEIARLIKVAFKRHWFSRIAAFLAAPALLWVKKRMDPARYNGASFLGLQGIVIKSHGGASILGYMHAIEEALVEVEKGVLQHIRERIAQSLGQAS